VNYEIKNENILYEKILNANLFAGLFEQDFESNFEHPTLQGPTSVHCSNSVRHTDQHSFQQNNLHENHHK